MFQMISEKQDRPTKVDWRILVLVVLFGLGLYFSLPFVPKELRLTVVLIPFIVGATALSTYMMIYRLRSFERKGAKRQDKTSRRSGSLLHTAPTTVQELFDGLPVALLRVSKNGRIKQTNQFSRDILGLREGDKPNLSDIVSGLDRPVLDWMDDLNKRAARGEPKLVQVTGPKSEVFLQVSLISLDPKGGSDMIAVMSDATELKTLEAQFVQSQKMQAIGQLAGGVAHDFNNLLTAISGYCDLLLLRHNKGDQDYNDLIQISQNSNRAAALVGQLLAFSRKQTLQPKALDVDEALADMTHLLNRLVGAKIDLSLHHAENLPNVYADKRQLEQVIMNLVVNARDAITDGGTVDVHTKEVVFEHDSMRERAPIQKGRYVQIKVTDNGRGISSKNLSQIFDPFFTTKDVGEGTGLGLSTVYGIIKQTGGFIFAESEKNQGATFEILLPATDHVEPVVKEVELTPNELVAKTLQGTTVLLVEDEVPVRSFAARALRMQDMEVYEAGSAEEAMKLLEDADLHIDIFVSDVIMPGEDGPTWVRKALQDRPDVNVIFVSGYAEETFSKEFGEIKGAQFLPKPFTLAKLIQTVHELRH